MRMRSRSRRVSHHKFPLKEIEKIPKLTGILFEVVLLSLPMRFQELMKGQTERSRVVLRRMRGWRLNVPPDLEEWIHNWKEINPNLDEFHIALTIWYLLISKCQRLSWHNRVLLTKLETQLKLNEWRIKNWRQLGT